MLPHRYERIRFCPQCGARYLREDFDGHEFLYRCHECEFAFYQNSAPSATVLVPNADDPYRVILLTRENDPGRGLLALPGGFLRYGENPEDGAQREAREEVEVEVSIERLLTCTLVDYDYLGSRLWALELAFLSTPVLVDVEKVKTREAGRVRFEDVRDLIRNPERLAFPEQRSVLQAYLAFFGSAGRKVEDVR